MWFYPVERINDSTDLKTDVCKCFMPNFVADNCTYWKIVDPKLNLIE